ncbi:MSMEG_1061 family FMN-dependent PPOX-type flavoprotein [Marinomonas ostreistagni]|uniref:MSMEG_1061 family FMN-dependent PPOX-type flavoprotein n=1 Tax=Marinomonas ostreistagni TaxID=359209 RepID=UPI00194E4B00|nr:MSMEG_1061 family FMN-dependent PPOX-type flavoprotein [Marinomonas ostreistagni]MBM6552038.1 pyridoxamine 5'-phosphate oxidase family protein [Marinomonas ostreistagni]
MAQITTLDQLEALYKAPHPIVAQKAISALEPHSQTFIQHSSFIVLSTQTAQGKMDISPRGGPAGFVQVLDNEHIVFGDHAGNNRLDTLHNLLHNPEISILFIIPGINEVLRVKGRASLHDDEDLIERCLEGKKRPKLVVKIAISELFFHCPKAMLVSHIWDSEHFTSRDILPSLGQIVQDQLGLDSLE